jgi:GntR family transcriptional regulator, transcriptional repressor for pyruvate dehydrogenase complex
VTAGLGQRVTVTRADDRAIHMALAELATYPEALGCSRLAAALSSGGLPISEPTAGRLLRDLDRQGLVERVRGKNGRVITPKGRETLAALETHRQSQEQNAEFLRAITARSLQDVIDLLHIRRAVESEIARLAALRATADDVRDIELATETYIRVMHEGASGREEHRAVHRAIANAAQSRVSSAVVDLILRDPQVYETMRRIQDSVGSVAPEDHRRVLAAIRARRPAEAAEAMHAHLARVVAVAERFAQAKVSGRDSGS